MYLYVTQKEQKINPLLIKILY